MRKKLTPTRSKTRPLLWQLPAVTPLAKQSNASRRPKPRQFGQSVGQRGGVAATPPSRGRLRIAGRSEEALNHPHGSNLSGGKPWLQHQGPRSSTDRCNGGSADGTNQLLSGACRYPWMGTRVRGLPLPPVFFRPKERGLRQIALGRILTERCEPGSSQQEQGKSQMALHLNEPTTMASTVAHAAV